MRSIDSNIKPIISFPILFILFQNCADQEMKPTKTETIIFRTSENNLIFRLNIDEEFDYYDSLLNRDITLGYKIGAYVKHQNTNSRIYLRINNKDTTFLFPLYKADSILFGLRQNGSFYIVTNHDKDAWIID
jgi:hypothetical protein